MFWLSSACAAWGAGFGLCCFLLWLIWLCALCDWLCIQHGELYSEHDRCAPATWRVVRATWPVVYINGTSLRTMQRSRKIARRNYYLKLCASDTICVGLQANVSASCATTTAGTFMFSPSALNYKVLWRKFLYVGPE